MNARAKSPAAPGSEQPPEQLLYAKWLDWGTRIGLVALVLLFLSYAVGMTQPHVPVEQLPQLWTLPVEEFIRATNTPTGWSWVFLAHRSDVANLVGIAILAGCSVICLLGLLAGYLRRGDRIFAALCLAETAVVVLAASGVFSSGH